MKINRKPVLLIVSCLFLICSAKAEYLIERIRPMDVDLGTNANFGQFRNRTGSYKAHDGLDYRTIDYLTGKHHREVFPVSSGTAYPHKANDSGWGRYVDIDHGGFWTRYAHLDAVSVEAGDRVTTSMVLGLSGSSEGGQIPGMGPHLHFSFGTTNANTPNTKNPIKEGLKKPEYGELRFVEDPVRYRKVRLLATGSDETFEGENQFIDVPMLGCPLLLVIEAYHKDNLDTNPYRVEIEAENMTDKTWGDQGKHKKIIQFDDMQSITASLESHYYCFSKPFVTTCSGNNSHDYYSFKIYPAAGVYKITARIYSCYRDGPGTSGFHLSAPETVTRTITVGLNSLDFNAAGYSYAWLPDDIANRGIMLASVPTHVGAASVGASTASTATPPEVFYAYANNNIITSNLLDVDPNLQQKALIESRATPEANWLIEIRNKSGGPPDRISVPKCGWLRQEWGAGKPPAT